MRWISAISRQASLEACLNECLEQVGSVPEPVQVAFLFAHSSFRDHLQPLLDRLCRQFRPEVLWGCSGGGVIGAATEVEHAPALSLTLAQMPGVECRGLHLEDDDLPSPDAPPEAWRGLLGLGEEGAEPAFLLAADPFEFDLDPLLQGLDYAFPRAVKLGGIASDGRSPGSNRLFLNDQVFSRGAVALALRGNLKVDAVVAQGCRPIGEPMVVTRGERNFILQLDGRPPLERLEKTLRSLSRKERSQAEHSLFLGIRGQSEVSLSAILEPTKEAPEGQFLIRNLVGLDPRKGGLVVGAPVRSGQTIQFHLRDAQSSAKDLYTQLKLYYQKGHRPAGGLLFSCLGRGEHLYQKANHDSEAFRKNFPQAPLGGFFGNGEIGPVGSTTYVHGYTSCFAMFRPGSLKGAGDE